MAFCWHKGTREEEGRPRGCPAGRAWSLAELAAPRPCWVHLQGVELGQVLEGRLPNELDGVVVEVAAKERSNWSGSAAGAVSPRELLPSPWAALGSSLTPGSLPGLVWVK